MKNYERLEIIAANEVPFRVLLVPIGAECPNHPSVSPATEPIVEFYDTRSMQTKDGQFVSRYFVSTLLEPRADGKTYGLDLYGGVSNWTIDATTMGSVRAWLEANA